jgi:hypothetical protein
MFQTPEAEALDLWFENLQNYEATLEDMAAASLDVNFKEELTAIEQWFKVLSEAERTAALYSLLQHSTQVQIRFFITVLQQMARSDPMTALLSPAMGGSMQNQMDAKLASIKSPGLKSGMPPSPSPAARNFNTGNRQSLALDNSSNFLSPDSAANLNVLNVPNDTPAAMLAQQRAKLKASNANHRISAPVLNSAGADIRASWTAASSLGQVSEQQQQLDTSQVQEVTVSRPKSTEFSGTIVNVPAAAADSWASMVSTPHTPMFGKKETRPVVNEPISRNDWPVAGPPGVPRMGDPTIHRRHPKPQPGDNVNTDGLHNNVYDDNGNPMGSQNQGRNALRNVGGSGWSNAGGRNQGVNNNNNNIPNRFGGNEEGSPNANANAASINGLAMQMNGFGLGSPTLGMGMPGLGMAPMSPFNMNMLSMMNMSPEAQLLAAQMAASGFGQANWLGMQPLQSAGILGGGGQRRTGPGTRSPALKSASSSRMDGHSTPRGDEEVDPALLNDIPAWLRSLRLHKYTPNFEGAKWQDMVLMDEAALEAKGVSALGARRKMLKTFEVVRKKMGIDGGPPSSVPPSSATPKSP